MYRHYWLLEFYSTSDDFDLGWRSKDQLQVKAFALIFLPTFQLICMCVEVIQAEHPDTTFEWDFVDEGT